MTSCHVLTCLGCTHCGRRHPRAARHQLLRGAGRSRRRPGGQHEVRTWPCVAIASHACSKEKLIPAILRQESVKRGKTVRCDVFVLFAMI